MAGEISLNYNSAATVYVHIWNRTSGFIWNNNDTVFEAYSSLSGALAEYPVSMTEQGTASKHYVGNFPTAIGAGVYDVTAYQKMNAWYAENDPVIAQGEQEWNGTIVPPLSNTSTSGQIAQISPMRLARGTMIQNFPVAFVSSADHVTALTSGVCSGQVSRDGGNFGALELGVFTEIGQGFYKVTLTSGDTLANTLAFMFTAVGVSGGASDPVKMSIITQRTSGQL